MKNRCGQNGVILTIAIAFAFLFSTCKKESNPIIPPDGRPVLVSSDYGKVVLTLVAYDTVRITHQMGLELRSPNVIRIGIGTKDSSVYVQSASYVTTYDPNALAYIIHFDFSSRLDSSKAHVPLTIRYYFADSTFADADTTVLAYKYPYPSAEIVVDFSTLPGLETERPQDVDRIGSSIFFHPTGSLGLYKFDIPTGHVTELLSYGGGDFIAADSVFVFCDVNHNQVRRYNLSLNQVDLVFPGLLEDIRGMDACNGFLYVANNFNVIRRYTYDGVLLDSASYYAYCFTIYDSVVYTPESGTLKRFDLRTQQYLQTLLFPLRYAWGVKEYQGKMYYCDYEKAIIAAVPIMDLRPVP